MTIRYHKIILLALFFIAATTGLRAQEIDSVLNILDENYPQEKIYLQMDKLYYNAGETIWFKAYITADNSPKAISKSCYAELLDEKGKLLQRKMMPVLESGAASSFDLPDTLPAGKLFVRAYTPWMLNFDSSLLYLKPLHIIPSKPAAKKSPVAMVYSLTLFPEGGDLVQDIASMVAFKATDQDGTPVDVSGDIVDGKGSKITSFSSTHDGMGYFSLQPLANEKYKAVWKDKKGVKHENELPAAKKNGLVLNVINPGNQLQYTLTRSAVAEQSPAIFYVIGQMHQRQVYGAKINLGKQPTVTVPVATDSLPDGVLQMTVFDADQRPIAERVVFINNNTYYFLTDLHAVEKNVTKRGRNMLQIDVGYDFLTNLSIAVTDGGINSVSNNETNIFTQLLLSSDLKGYVFNPAYYFSSDADSVRQQLDLVMMTNGWRRFNWEDILAGKWPVLTFLPENFLAIKGKVQGLSKIQLNDKTITGILNAKKSKPQFLNIPVDRDGRFNYGDLYFFDTSTLYYQFNGDADKTLTTSASFDFTSNFVKLPEQSINLFSSLYDPVKADSISLLKGSSLAKQSRDQRERNKVQTLSTVTVTAKQKSLKQKMNEEYTSGMFTSGDGYTFTTEDDPTANGSQTILAYLQSKVAGLQISTTGQGSATWRGSTTSLFVNEVNSDISQIQGMSMADVAMIKVFRPPFFGATGGGSGGAIAVYTKKGGGDNSSVVGLPSTKIAGYSVIKQFYSPDYATTNEAAEGDYRTTLYWNPYILMDKTTRRVTIPFYNSDNCKKIRVVIEGINELGQLTREEKFFE